MKRPDILLPNDTYFDVVANNYYSVQKEIFGDNINYFAADLFHEGGNVEGVDLSQFAVSCLKHTKSVLEDPVWFIQGWHNNPNRELLKFLPKKCFDRKSQSNR